MECYFTPESLKPGMKTCLVYVSSASAISSARWCPEEEYPEGLRDCGEARRNCHRDPEYTVEVCGNGTYCVEVRSGQERWTGRFTVCHLGGASRFAGGGRGSREDPYLIATCGQFNAIRGRMRSHFRLIADIDFQKEMDGLTWLPIGRESVSGTDPQRRKKRYCGFEGELDGSGHTVSGLVCRRDDRGCAGIFGSCGPEAYIHDLRVSGCRFYGGTAGSIAGTAVGSTIRRCRVTNTVISTGTRAGGIVGAAEYGVKIYECSFRGRMENPKPDLSIELSQFGGILGFGAGEAQSALEIRDCHVDARILDCGTGGGILNGINGAVRRCFFTGAVRAVNYAAGIAANFAALAMENCVVSGAELRFTSMEHPDFVVDGEAVPWRGAIGRICCASPDAPAKGDSYASADTRIDEGSGPRPPLEGSLQDGMTVSPDKLRDGEFYRALGWDLTGTW